MALDLHLYPQSSVILIIFVYRFIQLNWKIDSQVCFFLSTGQEKDCAKAIGGTVDFWWIWRDDTFNAPQCKYPYKSKQSYQREDHSSGLCYICFLFTFYWSFKNVILPCVAHSGAIYSTAILFHLCCHVCRSGLIMHLDLVELISVHVCLGLSGKNWEILLHAVIWVQCADMLQHGGVCLGQSQTHPAQSCQQCWEQRFRQDCFFSLHGNDGAWSCDTFH